MIRLLSGELEHNRRLTKAKKDLEFKNFSVHYVFFLDHISNFSAFRSRKESKTSLSTEFTKAYRGTVTGSVWTCQQFLKLKSKF